MMCCLESGNDFLFESMRKRFRRFLNNDGFELLLVDSQQFIDLELHVLTDAQSFGVQTLEGGEMEEDIFSKVFGANEAEFPIRDYRDYLSDAHLGSTVRETFECVQRYFERNDRVVAER